MPIMNRFRPATLQWFPILLIASVVSRGALGGEDKQQVETSQELLVFKRHVGAVQTLAFSPDGKSVASVGRDRSVKVWNASTGKELFTLEVDSGYIIAVAFSPDGKRVAAGQTNSVKVWDMVTGQEVHTLPPGSERITSIAFSPDGKYVAVAS